ENGQGWYVDPESFTLTHTAPVTLAVRRDSGYRPAPRIKPLDEAWVKKVAAMPTNAQIVAVADKMKERNPGFDGELNPVIESGQIVGLRIDTEKVEDIMPLKPLRHLTQ